MKESPFATLAVFFSVLLTAASVNASSNLNVLCSNQIDWCEAMVQAFEAETGISVSMVRKSTGESLAKIRSEAGNPQVDVWWAGTGDPHLQAAADDLTLPYKPDTSSLAAWAVNLSDISGGRTIGIYAGALGYAYNKEILVSEGLPAPGCWSDLTKPVYRNAIQIANPHSSGTGFTALSTFVQLFGEDGAFKFLIQMDKNVTRYTKTGSAPGRTAARGETLIAIGFIHDLAALANGGFPLQLVEPCEGTGYEVGGVSIIKGARNLENAKRWVDYSLRADVQMIGYSSHGFLSTPSNLNADLPPEAPNLSKIKLIDYDFKTFGSPEMRRHLLDRWTKEVKGTRQ